MGNWVSLGFYPLEGYILPKGMHNAIPEILRPYWFYYPKSNVPLPHTSDWSDFYLFTLGLKAFPDYLMTSINRQMYKAIINSNFEKIENIIDNGLMDITKDVVLDNGMTALGMACALDLVEIVHYLTLRGVDYEHKIGPYEKTALHIAVEYGNEITAKYLLNNGANIKAKDKFGFDVFDKVEFRGYYNFKKFLNHFKDNPKERNIIDFDKYRYLKGFILEDIDTITFKPSDLLEISIMNKDNINLDNFHMYIYNQYELKNVEKVMDNHPNNRNRYDNLYYFNPKYI
jgi:hypothetical protein